MASRRSLVSLINKTVKGQPLNKAFLSDVMSAIEYDSRHNVRKPSSSYKPSSLVCMRQMYFTRTEAEADPSTDTYDGIGMADTGSRRHEAIQDVLMKMKDRGYDWEYVDVETYLKHKQAQGKCLNLRVYGKRGAETHLKDDVLHLSFMCDGIMRHIPTNNHYLFEFKNQVSFKYNNKSCVDLEHHDQVICYCMELDLDAALVLYENRDVCALECPEVFQVTQDMKDYCLNKILECDGYVERLIPPPKHPDTKPCRWCRYKTQCKKAGN